jgi:hypothetical protein
LNGKTLLFIDEIQACPEAIVSLRYFYEQMTQLHIITAGSLLDHTLNETKLSMPVGRVEFCYMHQMSFREFLWAMGETRLDDYLGAYTLNKAFSEAIHNKLLDVERVHSSILTSLQHDFAKYGSCRS